MFCCGMLSVYDHVLFLLFVLFFFFKQKTAYEMRISDWSSDVCSSDLHPAHGAGKVDEIGLAPPRAFAPAVLALFQQRGADHLGLFQRTARQLDQVERGAIQHPHQRNAFGIGRSEEHTSELQSLMRISYAVFCLKKKK